MAGSEILPITISSLSFGLAMTECLFAKGDTVIETLRNPAAISHFSSSYPSSYPSSHLSVLQLDISQRAQGFAVFAYIKGRSGWLDLVFNSADTNIGEAQNLIDNDQYM
ncbi:hypothetical protein CONPUDRAFT_85131 [Coniophora puteana RWD-64-598 SS2]|uniref:Ketoreductase (KR) domain-containing protein n=1 Tax=Coniophora puteana (strain RWD-64-598) TaxID=741705 RepID=A0A5M3M9X0_CONPW|nr:uncharacterized protein CONPUDRAFT_85131 [Coniophora puteana RWD-64-598 SS2]EIW75897.1 hypothetical protein CONPUDRAFT_85131 [Coniophora puteana RWD-64-598 SS2]